MKAKLVSVFVFLCSTVVAAQEWTVIADNMHFEAQLGKEPVSAMDVYEKFAGTPFLNDEFVEGSLITTDSLMYQNVLLRYNIFKDEMEFKLKNENVYRVIANPRNFLFINIDNLVFQYLAFSDKNRPAQGYFQIYSEGDCQVLMRIRTDYAEPEGARGFEKAKPPRFEEKRNTFFVKFGQQLPQEVRFTRKNILALFGNKRNEVAAFVKDNKLSYRRADDLVKMADWYNQMTNR